jgi:hypothetical protein
MLNGQIVENETDAQWKEALQEELRIVRAKAAQPCPQGISSDAWDAITAPYKMEIPVLKAMLGQLDQRFQLFHFRLSMQQNTLPTRIESLVQFRAKFLPSK